MSLFPDSPNSSDSPDGEKRERNRENKDDLRCQPNSVFCITGVPDGWPVPSDDCASFFIREVVRVRVWVSQWNQPQYGAKAKTGPLPTERNGPPIENQ